MIEGRGDETVCQIGETDQSDTVIGACFDKSPDLIFGIFQPVSGGIAAYGFKISLTPSGRS